MSHDAITSFLLWNAAANFVLLYLSFGLYATARGRFHRLYQRWFQIESGRLDELVFLLLGLYKLAIWMLLLIPALVMLALS